jgi:outer membrane protein
LFYKDKLMKICNRLAAFCLVFIFATSVWAQTPAWSQTNGILKIGVVDINRLLSESPQFQEARARIEDEFAPREREIIAMGTALEENAKKLEKDSPVMGESEREAAQRELRNAERDMVRAQKQFQEDAQMRETEIMRDIQQEIGQEIEGYGRTEGYDIILPRGGAGVIFASSRVDQTSPLIKRLLAAHQAGTN